MPKSKKSPAPASRPRETPALILNNSSLDGHLQIYLPHGWKLSSSGFSISAPPKKKSPAPKKKPAKKRRTTRNSRR